MPPKVTLRMPRNPGYIKLMEQLNEFYTSDEKGEKEMKKEDLKALYVVELRNGEKEILVNYDSQVYKKELYSYKPGRSGCQVLESYNDDLTFGFGQDADIIKVWGYSSELTEVLTTKTDHRKLLWKREEAKEMTIEEIQKELGYKIKVVE